MLLTARKTENTAKFVNSNSEYLTSNSGEQIRSEEIIKLSEIIIAARRIAPYIKRTPLFFDEDLSSRFETNIYLKHEMLQKTSAFKVRGAFNKLLTLTEAERNRGLVAVSGGNHAQAVAYAAKKLGCKALILMPESTPQNYVEKTKRHGADIELYPAMHQAFERAKDYERGGMIYIHPFDDPMVIAGQGTIGLEILEDVPQVTDVILSIGGGGLAGGIGAAIKALKPEVKIWGAETKGAESMKKALEANMVVELEKITSIAKTLGAPSVSELTLRLAKRHLSGVTVVEDSEAVDEMFYLLDRVKVVTEPAAACALAAAAKLSRNFDATSHVVILLCGGNIGLKDMFEFRDFGVKA